MRNYKQKMDKYRLPKSRRLICSAFCHTTNAERLQTVADVLEEEFGEDAIRHWIYYNVVLGWNWAKLESERVPCSQDVFRIYRARFFFALDRKLNGADISTSEGSNMEANDGEQQ